MPIPILSLMPIKITDVMIMYDISLPNKYCGECALKRQSRTRRSVTMATLRKAKILIDQLQDTLLERKRIIEVIRLTPSENDNFELRQLVDRTSRELGSLREQADNGQIGDYNDLIDKYEKLLLGIDDESGLEIGAYKVEKLTERADMTKEVRFEEHKQMEMQPFDPYAESSPFKPYRDNEEDNDNNTDDMPNHQMFAQHQQTMIEQDQELDQLHQSVQRQHSMGRAIHEELNDHIVLLDDFERQVDDSTFNLDRAQRRLSHFRKQAQENGSLVTIIVLTVILITLLVVLN